MGAQIFGRRPFRLIRAYPVFGCGLGGYETAFSRFKISGVLVTDDFVHNDYLQLLAELGLVGFVIGAALAFSVVRMALRGAVKSSDPEARYFAVACVGALSRDCAAQFGGFQLIHSCECDAAGVDCGNGGERSNCGRPR